MNQRDVQICKVSGHHLAYYRAGSGETILLVHGITTYSFIWRKIVPLLHANYDVVAIDLLGCGESDKPLDVEYSVKRHAELLREFIAKLGLDKLHWVGHDIGGGIGQRFAVHYPELLFDLTLINTVAYNFWPVQPIVAMRTPVVRLLAMASLDLGAFKLIVQRGLYHKERATSELMDYFWQPLRTKAGRKAFLHFARCLDNQHLMEIQDDLRRLQIPLLIIRGDADLYLSAEISGKLHREIPGSKLVRIATGGHFIQEDEPEKVAETLVGFFEEKRDAEKSRRKMPGTRSKNTGS